MSLFQKVVSGFILLICIMSCSKIIRKTLPYKNLNKDYLLAKRDSAQQAERIDNFKTEIKSLKSSIDSLERIVANHNFPKPEINQTDKNEDEIKNYVGKESLNSLDLNGNESFMIAFKNHDFYAYKLNEAMEIKLFWKDINNKPIRNISKLKIGVNGKEMLFGMNAGIFKQGGVPEGLYIENGKELVALNLESKEGNFYMKPNGVFYILENGTVGIEQSDSFEVKQNHLDIKYATQSGPMLVNHGIIHPKFVETSTNLHVRNGVGIDEEGKVIFLISKRPVNLYTFASIFKNHLSCKNALYLDGAISEAYIPGLNKIDSHRNFGPLIGVYEK